MTKEGRGIMFIATVVFLVLIITFTVLVAIGAL